MTSEWFDSGRSFLDMIRRIDSAGQTIPIRDLVVALDRLVCSRWACPLNPVDPEYLVDPELDYPGQHAMFSRLLPEYGFYEMLVGSIALNQEIVTGDVIDDMCDIWSEVRRTQILHERYGPAVAADFFAWSFDSHWEGHSRNVILAFFNLTAR